MEPGTKLRIISDPGMLGILGQIVTFVWLDPEDEELPIQVKTEEGSHWWVSEESVEEVKEGEELHPPIYGHTKPFPKQIPNGSVEPTPTPLSEKGLTVSDGGSTSYYALPDGATDLQDLIEYKSMNFSIGNMFKAIYRLGEKSGNSLAYDLNKIIWYANRELQRL